MKSVTVLLVNDQALILRIPDAEAFRVDDTGYLYVGTVAVFSPTRWNGVYESDKGTIG